MTITRADLLSEVLEDIGVLAIGANPSAEDNAKALSKYKFVHAYFQANDLLPFDNDDPIPEEYVQAMVYATAEALKPSYMLPADARMALEAAEAMIYKVNRDYSGVTPTKFEDF